MTNLFNQVIQLIAENTGNDISELTAESHLEEDLNITEVELKRLIIRINRHFEISLHPNEIVEQDPETLQDLVDLISEEAELG